MSQAAHSIFQRMVDVLNQEIQDIVRRKAILVDIGSALADPDPIGFLVSRGYTRENAEFAISKARPDDPVNVRVTLEEMDNSIGFFESMKVEYEIKLKQLENPILSLGDEFITAERLIDHLRTIRESSRGVGVGRAPFSEEEELKILELAGVGPIRPRVVSKTRMNRHERRAARSRAKKRR